MKSMFDNDEEMIDDEQINFGQLNKAICDIFILKGLPIALKDLAF